MAQFAIMNNILGIREDLPHIKLNKAFSPESENVMLFEGEAKRIRGRLKDFTDATYTTGTVTIVEDSATVTGDVTVWFNGSLVPLWAGRAITIIDGDDTVHTHVVKSVDSTSQITLTVAITGSAGGAGNAGLSYVLGTSAAKVQAPDTNTIIHYHDHDDARNNVEYIFAFTKAHVYRWLSNYSAFFLYHTTASDVTLWSTADFNDKVIATNFVDKVQVWSNGGPAGSADIIFDDLDSASGLDLDGGGTYLTKAKYVEVYENYVFLGYTEEDGNIYPFRRRHSSLGDEADWDVTGTGDTGKKDFLGKGEVKGFGIYTANNSNLLITFMKKGVKGSIQMSWPTTDDIVFENDELNNQIGLLSPHSVINDKDGNLYFLATDFTIRRLFADFPISRAIQGTFKGLNVDFQETIKSTFIDEFNWLAWSIPKDGSSTGNDVVLYYDIDESRIADIDIWYKGDWDVAAFGHYTRQSTLSIDLLDGLSSTIDGLDTSGLPTIDAVEARTGFPLDLVSDYSGYTFNLHAAEDDDGNDYTGTLVIATDLSEKNTLNVFKRLNEGITHYFNAESEGTVTQTYKTEDDASWQGSESLSLIGTGRTVRPYAPMDIRSRDFLFRLQATNTFSWLGAIFDFAFDGKR